MLVASGEGHRPLGKKSWNAVPGLRSSHATQCQATPVPFPSGVTLLSYEETKLDSQHVIPKGPYTIILSGPHRLSKGEQVKSHFSLMQLCQLRFLHMPSFKLSSPLPNAVWQVPGTSLLQDKGESSEEKWLPQGQGTRASGAHCCLPRLQRQRPKTLEK